MNTKKIVATSMFSAVIMALSLITIPTPFGIDITLQTFAIALCGYVLGIKSGLASTGIYVLLGIIGLPVFSAHRGGPGVLVGMTGGFIWGFFVLVALCGIWRNKTHGIFLGVLGLLVCHFLGILQFSLVMSTDFTKSFMIASMPFIAKDIASVVAAYFLALTVRRKTKRWG